MDLIGLENAAQGPLLLVECACTRLLEMVSMGSGWDEPDLA